MRRSQEPTKALLSILLAILWFAGERESGGVSSHPGGQQMRRGVRNQQKHCYLYYQIFYGLQVKGNLEGFPLILVGNKCEEESGANKSIAIYIISYSMVCRLKGIWRGFLSSWWATSVTRSEEPTKALLSILSDILWFAGERESGGVSSHPSKKQM